MGISDQVQRGQDPFAALRGLGKTTPSEQRTITVSPVQARARRLRRSQELVNAIRSLDAHNDPVAMTQWIGWIKENYQVSDCGLLLGLFSHCYLGSPYIDHHLDLSLEILKHFTPSDAVPPGFEPARPYARTEAYAYIEVYTDGAVIPIYPDGRPG